MGLFDKLFSKSKTAEKEAGNLSSQDVIDVMIMNADIYMEQGDFEHAFHTYKQIVSLQPNTTAQYNLGSLYAQGKGTEQSFLEGAYWFHQANLAGDEQAGKLCTKCMMDYVHQNFDKKTPGTVFDEMIHLASYLYPRENSIVIAAENIYALAGFHFNRKEYAAAAKLFRSAAEYGNHGDSQNYLAVLYNAGAGVEKNDLVSLYWFDRAVDNHVEAAKQDRDGILNAYKNNFSPEEFYDTMMLLSRRCSVGDEDVPKDAEKAAYWRKAGEGSKEETAH